MEDLIKEVATRNAGYNKEQVIFTDYCKSKMQERKIDENLVISTIFSNMELYYAELQKRPFKGSVENRYKLVYKISSRYSLIIVISYEERILKVINVIKTSKELKLQWRKKILK